MAQFKITRRARYTLNSYVAMGDESIAVIDAPDLQYAIDCAADLYSTPKFAVVGVCRVSS